VADKDALIEGYARGLFAVAEAEGALDEVADELFRFARTVEAEGALREALIDLSLPADRKKAVLAELLGERANRHTLNLLGFLVDQGRARDLSKIVDRLVALAAEQRRHVVAEVTAAVPLKAEQRTRLAEALSKATGREVEVKVLVDPGMIGGVVARVGDQVFDGSIRGRFREVREQLGSV
jgi:F-type H+-transporting ATPase subunit delta